MGNYDKLEKKWTNLMKKQVLLLFSMLIFANAFCQQKAFAEIAKSREHCLMDFNWRFALGHAVDAEKDFNFGTGYFSF